jgi:hypothetical protein
MWPCQTVSTELVALLCLLVVAVLQPPFLAYSARFSREMATVTSVISNPPAVIQTLIDTHTNGINTQDKRYLFLSVFGDTAIIVDGIAPHRWLNPNAPANWLTDVEKWRENLGVIREQVSDEVGFWHVTIKGKSVIRTGTLAYTFTNRDRPCRGLAKYQFNSP